MGINADFLIKHVRPADMEAYNLICNARGAGSLHDYLVQAGVTPQQIDTAFNLWAGLAVLDIGTPANLPAYANAAIAISQARWQEFYQTAASTIMFLNGPLLRELSYQSERHAGANFDFDPAEQIPLAITVPQHGNQVQVQRNLNGAHLTSDAHGNACHFAGLF
ncbi:hypothetical protein [Deinococcus multiflagellatus]|uniref:Uncharacterized protein n=1 Tax=Deinococcus multiflagellatus TaxID=1656887 RepID=A0ABW1ZUC2_9DEIO|nr:hypothetical protein [Deinococcus multiflagellatus]MBZ9716041.1 hypothetical protein [Deinococcus multiflagellatus]